MSFRLDLTTEAVSPLYILDQLVGVSVLVVSTFDRVYGLNSWKIARVITKMIGLLNYYSFSTDVTYTGNAESAVHKTNASISFWIRAVYKQNINKNAYLSLKEIGFVTRFQKLIPYILQKSWSRDLRFEGICLHEKLL